MMEQSKIRVRYQETDAMGVAHHAAFLGWFELGRSDLIRSRGRSYAEIEAEEGVFLPVVELQARYHSPARYDELLRLETSVENLDRVRMTFAYRLYHEADGTLLAEGSTRHAVLDENQKPVRIPVWMREMLETGT